MTWAGCRLSAGGCTGHYAEGGLWTAWQKDATDICCHWSSSLFQCPPFFQTVLTEWRIFDFHGTVDNIYIIIFEQSLKYNFFLLVYLKLIYLLYILWKLLELSQRRRTLLGERQMLQWAGTELGWSQLSGYLKERKQDTLTTYFITGKMATCPPLSQFTVQTESYTMSQHHLF